MSSALQRNIAIQVIDQAKEPARFSPVNRQRISSVVWGGLPALSCGLSALKMPKDLKASAAINIAFAAVAVAFTLVSLAKTWSTVNSSDHAYEVLDPQRGDRITVLGAQHLFSQGRVQHTQKQAEWLLEKLRAEQRLELVQAGKKADRYYRLKA